VNVRNEHDRRSAARAVSGWAQFPADASPRPIVLLHSVVRVEDGFLSGNAKLAFLDGVIEAAEGVPEEPVRLMRVPQASAPAPGAPLHVTGAVLAESTFATDRGPCTLPA